MKPILWSKDSRRLVWDASGFGALAMALSMTGGYQVAQGGWALGATLLGTGVLWLLLLAALIHGTMVQQTVSITGWPWPLPPAWSEAIYLTIATPSGVLIAAGFTGNWMTALVAMGFAVVTYPLILWAKTRTYGRRRDEASQHAPVGSRGEA